MSGQAPILTITLNPALDLESAVPQVRPGPKLRLSPPRAHPGGGGVNVARAITILGGEVRALALLGGATGAVLRAMIAEEIPDLVAFEVPGETRQSLTVHEQDSGREYRFVLPGADWPETRTPELLAAIAAAAPSGFAVLSGSQPPGMSAAFPAMLAGRLGSELALVVDTSGPALAALLKTGGAVPEVLRLDAAEAEAVAGTALPRAADTAAFARALLVRGVAREVIIARGADGSVLVDGEGALHCVPPPVTVNSRVGAGDSFVAGFVLARARGEGRAEALRLGTAAASAAVMTPGTELCRAADVARLLPECRLSEP